MGEKVIRGVNPGEQFIKIVHDELVQIMGTENTELAFEEKNPRGSGGGVKRQGKTTFSAKLALYLKERKIKSVVDSCRYLSSRRQRSVEGVAASAQVFVTILILANTRQRRLRRS